MEEKLDWCKGKRPKKGEVGGTWVGQRGKHGGHEAEKLLRGGELGKEKKKSLADLD